MTVRPGRPLAAVLALVVAITIAGALTSPRPARSQAADVLLNVMASGAKKLNIAIPDFTVVAGADPQGLGKRVPEVTGKDLTFSGLFSVVSDIPAPAADNPEALKELWANFAAAGAHAGLHGLLRVRGDRVDAEMRLYDLTDPAQRLIAVKKFEMPLAQARRLSHKVADEVVFQFTGEPGVADTKVAYVASGSGSKELYAIDYDGANLQRLTSNGSINLSPVWSPDTRSLAFTSFMNGYPFLYRLFVFERRPVQLLAGHPGINTSPAWSPDGRQVALTLSKDGNPQIYVLTVATGGLIRLTTYTGIDTEPTWSPDGTRIAFVSERGGARRST